MKIDKPLEVFKIFSLSLDLTTYINSMSGLMGDESELIKNELEINKKIHSLDTLKKEINEFSSLEMKNTGFPVDLINSLSESVDMFYILHEQILSCYAEKNIKKLLEVSKLFKELSVDTVKISNIFNKK